MILEVLEPTANTTQSGPSSPRTPRTPRTPVNSSSTGADAAVGGGNSHGIPLLQIVGMFSFLVAKIGAQHSTVGDGGDSDGSDVSGRNASKED